MKNIALILSVFLLGITSAWAVQPEKDNFLFHFQTCPEEGDMFPIDCGDGLFICEEFMIDITTMLFFDKNDEPIRYWELDHGTGILYELGNPDHFLQYKPTAATFELDFIEGTSTITGALAMVTVPGYGHIYRDIGRISSGGTVGVWPPYTFEAGEHQWLKGDVEALCNYMAGN